MICYGLWSYKFWVLTWSLYKLWKKGNGSLHELYVWVFTFCLMVKQIDVKQGGLSNSFNIHYKYLDVSFLSFRTLIYQNIIWYQILNLCRFKVDYSKWHWEQFFEEWLVVAVKMLMTSTTFYFIYQIDKIILWIWVFSTSR